MDGTGYRYEQATPASETSLNTRTATYTGPAGNTAAAAVNGGSVRGSLVATSLRENGFLAFGVTVHRPGDHQKVAADLAATHDGDMVDVTGEIVEAMRAFAAEKGVSWDLIRSADAAEAGSRDARGLRAVLDQVMPRVCARIEGQVFDDGVPAAPLVLTELSPLARYGYLDLVARLADLSAPRRRPVWVVLPQMRGQRGAVVDGEPIQLGSPGGQFVTYSVGKTEAVESEKV